MYYFYYKEHIKHTEFYSDCLHFEELISWLDGRKIHLDFFLGHYPNGKPLTLKDEELKEFRTEFQPQDLLQHLEKLKVQVYEYKLQADDIYIETCEPIDNVIRMPIKESPNLIKSLFDTVGINMGLFDIIRKKQGVMFQTSQGEMIKIGEFQDLNEWHNKRVLDKWRIRKR